MHRTARWSSELLQFLLLLADHAISHTARICSGVDAPENGTVKADDSRPEAGRLLKAWTNVRKVDFATFVRRRVVCGCNGRG